MRASPRANFSTLQPLQPDQDATPTPDYSPLSSPLTPSSPPFFPRPLRISKRPYRKLSATIPPRRSSLADAFPQTSDESTDEAPTPRPPSKATMPTRSPAEPQLAPPTSSTTPRRTPSTAGFVSHCSVCEDRLSVLQSYSFPKTVPAIAQRIRELCPGMSEHARFCARCFEAIRAMHICWACGEDIHRREERVGCGWAWWHWGCMRCLLCRSPLPPPPWTSEPTTLSVPPSCKACTRELRELAYQERIRKQAITPAARAVHGVELDRSMSRKISLGVRYPPLPRWMEKLPGNKSKEKGTGVAVKWMEKLPGNRKQRSGSGNGNGNGNGRGGGSGRGYGSVRERIVVGAL